MSETYTSLDRRRLAAAYATAVHTALAPAATRDLRRVADPAAPELLPASLSLATAASAGLSAADPLEVAAAEVQLLAGAALDLLLAGHLAGPAAPAVRGYAAELSIAPARAFAADLAELQTVVEAPEAYLAGSVAGRGLRSLPVRRTRTLSSAATELEDAVHAALAGIRTDVVTSGGHTVEGLLLLDAAVLREAIAVVGGDLAGKLGLDLGGISAQALRFVLAANDKLVALLGREVLGQAHKRLTGWMEQLRKGTLFPALAERVLRTRATEAEIKAWLAAYAGPEAGLEQARDEITLLAGRFAAKARIADKVTAGLALAKVVPLLMTPAGRLAVTATYLGLLAYLIGSGYDHIDSDRIKLLDRVEGVRGISKRLLVG